MARNQEAVTCLPGAWTELTNDNVTEITFQVVTGSVKDPCHGRRDSHLRQAPRATCITPVRLTSRVRTASCGLTLH
jgi:hypothetical protein